MCGRYASTRSAVDLVSLFDALDETDGALVADYNVAPTDPAPIVRRSERAESPVLSVGRWGLVPAWATSPAGAARMINARAETVATSPAFARSFAQRRCLVPIDGWYEWARQGSTRQPFFMTRRDEELLVLGGIWSTWNASSYRLMTFSIVTLPAQGHLATVHDRMPLIIEPRRWEEWLNASDVSGLLAPPSPEYSAAILLRKVSSAVGDVRNDGPELVREVTVEVSGESIMEQSEPTLF